MRAPQPLQRPRRTAYERSGTFSFQASSWPHDMHAEPGLTIERRSGTRAATTFRNEPSARPGASASIAKAIVGVIGDGRPQLECAAYLTIVIGSIDTPAFGGTGAPTGMFWMTGSGLSAGLLARMLMLPMLIGPWTVVLLPEKLIPALGWVKSEPWNALLFETNEKAAELEESEARVSMELFPLVPCQFEVEQFAAAHSHALLLLKVIVPAAMIMPVPV